MSISDFREQARAAFDFNTSKKALQERIEQQLVITYKFKEQTGMFKATVELMAFLNLWDEPEIVVKDIYDTPMLVNREELLFNLKMAYRVATNAWAVEYADLKKIRKIENV